MKKLMILSCALLFLIACGSSENEEKAYSDTVSITTVEVPDAQTGKSYEAKIDISGGSGEYILNAELPLGLNITPEGIINGTIHLEPATYTFIVNAIDKNYSNNKCSKEFTLKVVAYLPDQYEPDNEFPVESGNVITPDSGSQLHTIHEAGDIDFYSVDLSSANESDLIIFKGVFTGGSLVLRLYNSEMEPIEIAINDENPNETIIRYTLAKPDKYYVSANNQALCEYSFEVKNTNAPIELVPEALSYAESVTAYNQIIKTKGSDGKEKIFTIESGTLPDGLSINGSTGQITGMSFKRGVFVFNVKVTENDNPENYDIKEYSITAYEGKKVIATDIEKYLTWVDGPSRWVNIHVGRVLIDTPDVGTGLFKTTVQSSHQVVFEEVTIPQELSSWTMQTINNGPKYTFNAGTGEVCMKFASRNLDSEGKVYTPNDYPLINKNGEWLKHTLTYKVYDAQYPENFDIFTYKVNMEIRF